MKKLMIIALVAVATACGSGMKLTNSNYSELTDKGTQVQRDQYVFGFDKKSGDYIEIVEVKLLNKEKAWEESVPFQVTDKDGKQTILDVKGRNSFAVVASKPKSAVNTLATSAIIVYRTEADGERKSYTVKKFGK